MPFTDDEVEEMLEGSAALGDRDARTALGIDPAVGCCPTCFFRLGPDGACGPCAWRKAAPVRYAALDAIGHRGPVEVEELWPAVEKLVAALGKTLDEPDGGIGAITLAALIGAARTWYESVDKTVNSLVALWRQYDGGPLDLADLRPEVREMYNELLDVGTAAAQRAQAEQEPA
jgi:hypothetical protein